MGFNSAFKGLRLQMSLSHELNMTSFPVLDSNVVLLVGVFLRLNLVVQLVDLQRNIHWFIFYHFLCSKQMLVVCFNIC